MSQKEKVKDLIKKIRNFFEEVILESKKVVWPARDELLKATAIVIFVVLIFAIYLGVFDFILTFLFSLV